MAKQDWRAGIQSLARGENKENKPDWRTGIQSLAKADESVVYAGPIEHAEGNWADQKIAEYERMKREADAAQFNRDVLARKLEIEKRKKAIEARRRRAMPFSFQGPSFPQEAAEFEQRAKEKISGAVTPEARRDFMRSLMGYAGGLHAKHPMLLAALGGAAGESLYQMGQHAVGSPKAPQSPGEAAKRIGISGGIEFAEEGAARGLMKVLSPGGDIPQDRRATIKWMRERGIEPTLAQATESQGLYGILEGVAEGSFTGGPGMRRHKANVERLLSNYGDDIVSRFGGMSDVDAGKLIKGLITNTKATRQALVKPMYEEVSRLSKGRLVPTRPIKEKAVKILRNISRRGPEKGATSIMPSLENKQLVRIMRDIATTPEYVPIQDILWARRQIGQIAFAHPTEKTGMLFSKQTERTLQDFYFDMGKIYQDPKIGLPREATEILKKANKIVSESHDIFDKNLIKRIVKEHSEDVIRSIVKPGAVSNVDEVLKATGPEGKQALRGAFVSNLVKNEAVTPEGVLSGKKLLNYIKKIDESVLDKFMSKQQLEELQFFGDALRVAAAKPTNLGGGLTIKILQGGTAVAALGLFFPGVPGGAKAFGASEAAILLGPKAIEVLFTNPTMVKALSNTLLTEGGPKQVTRLLTRVLSNKALKKAMAEDKEDREKRRRETLKEAAMKYQHIPL